MILSIIIVKNRAGKYNTDTFKTRRAFWVLYFFANKKPKHNLINIGRGNSTSINDIAAMISSNHIFIEEVLEPFENLANNKKAKKLLNWQPKTNLKDWIKKNGL